MLISDKEVTIDQDIDVDRLYVEGTVRVCSNCGDIKIRARAILINTGMGTVVGNRNSIQFQKLILWKYLRGRKFGPESRIGNGSVFLLFTFSLLYVNKME